MSAALIQQGHLTALRRRLDGDVLTADSPEYDQARRVWNAMIDRRPAAVARCANTDDVTTAVEFARTHGLTVTVRGGGHNIAGTAVCNGGLMVDLSRMKGVRVDPNARLARAQGGVTWAEFDRRTQAFGLATTGGMVSTTGIAGLTLGGGLGWLMRRYCLTCDNLRSAQVITADGRKVAVDADSHADLFWAIRGGGGQFGIVTSFEYRLHEVKNVLAGVVFHRAERAYETLRLFKDFCADAPDQLTMLAVISVGPPAPFMPQERRGQTLVGIAVCYAGDLKQGERVIAPLRSFGPPALDLISQFPYCVFQSMMDPTAPAGLLNYSKSLYLSELNESALREIVARVRTLPTPLCQFHIHHLQGAVARVPQDDTAFAARDATFLFKIPAAWTSPSESDAVIQWTRTVWQALYPFGTGTGYVNFLADTTEDELRIAYGHNLHQRFSDLRARYDPANIFRVQHNTADSAQ